jgi:hypothetical protein
LTFNKCRRRTKKFDPAFQSWPPEAVGNSQGYAAFL